MKVSKRWIRYNVCRNGKELVGLLIFGIAIFFLLQMLFKSMPQVHNVETRQTVSLLKYIQTPYNVPIPTAKSIVNPDRDSNIKPPGKPSDTLQSELKGPATRTTSSQVQSASHSKNDLRKTIPDDKNSSKEEPIPPLKSDNPIPNKNTNDKPVNGKGGFKTSSDLQHENSDIIKLGNHEELFMHATSPPKFPEDNTKPTHKTSVTPDIFQEPTTVKPDPVLGQYEVTKKCLPTMDTSNIRTPFKVYVYDLPKLFNKEIQRNMTDDKKFSYCYNLDYCGMGEELYQLGGTETTNNGFQRGFNHRNYHPSLISVRNTHQFSLETIIHYKMLNSPYRTLDPEAADVFYIPAYSGLNCLLFNGDSQTFVNKLFNYLNKKLKSYFHSGKPHLVTLSKIQREQGSQNCPLLLNPNSKNITFIGIEKEANPNWITWGQVKGKLMIVAPYPSYVHFIPSLFDRNLQEFDTQLSFLKTTKFRLNTTALSERNVLLFLAAGTRRSNFFRAKILDQFMIKVSTGYDNFTEQMRLKNETMPEQVMLITSECSKGHRTTTIPWMMRSKYCLQPPGDSPTRKSIYDSILSGCIPVLFADKHPVTYPFDSYLNYADFTYTINKNSDILDNKTILQIIQEIPDKTTEVLYNNVRKVAKWFQYSLSNADINDSDDAFTFLLHDIAVQHNLYNKNQELVEF